MQIPQVQAQLAGLQYGALGVPQPMVVVAPQAGGVLPAQQMLGGVVPGAVGGVMPGAAVAGVLPGAVPGVGPVGAGAVRPAIPVVAPAGPAAAAAAAAAAANKQKKRKFGTERPAAADKSSNAVPESALYNHLLDMDRLVSDVITRRKADFKEPFPPYNEPVKRTLRIAVQALYSNQPAPPKPAPPGPANDTKAAALAAAAAARFAPAPESGPGTLDTTASDEPEPPSWTLQVTGALVDPADALVRAALAAAAAAAARGDPASAALLLQAQQLATQHANAQQAALASGAARNNMLTNVVRRIEIQLDPELYPGDSGRVVWDKGNHVGLHRDAIEVRRLGSRSCRATLLIQPDYQPERYLLPPLLSEVLGMLGHETRSRILVALYGFIKSRRLQDPNNPINVNLTPELAQVFGCRTLKLSDLGPRLSSMLVPIPPVKLEYEIKLDNLRPSPADLVAVADDEEGPRSLSGQCAMALLDVDFFLPSPNPHQMGAVLQSFYKEKEIEAMDAKVAVLIRRLNECRRRRALLLGFAHRPIDTAHALLAAQARDVRMARQSSGRDYEVERRTEVFRQRWVEDAVMNYLHKKLGHQPQGDAA